MKKSLILLLLLLSFVANAQFTLLNEQTGMPINNGDVVTVSTNNFTTHLTLTNTHNTDIGISLEAVNIVNTDGTEMGFCFGINGGGNCYPGMTVGTTYQGGGRLAPGASTGSDDIDFMHNDDPANFPTYPKDYILKFYATDNLGGQIGSPIQFTYRYDPGASIAEFSSSEFKVYDAGNRILSVYASNQIDVNIYSITGQQVRVYRKLSRGMHKLHVDLPSGIYLVHAKGLNKQAYKKILIK